ncbi:MAG: hypothetical protein ACR2FN_11995 [Chitinophagaceae bacterium]
MFILFDHNGEFVTADLIYNFKQIKDTILLRQLNLNIEINEDILFYKNGNDWYSDSKLKNEFPRTYSNISKAIIENLHIEELFDEVYLQMYLS